MAQKLPESVQTDFMMQFVEVAKPMLKTPQSFKYSCMIHTKDLGIRVEQWGSNAFFNCPFYQKRCPETACGGKVKGNLVLSTPDKIHNKAITEVLDLLSEFIKHYTFSGKR